MENHLDSSSSRRQDSCVIAIFDDSSDTLKRYSSILAGKTDSIQTYRTPELTPEIIRSLLHRPPDLIILDLLMGESKEDGYRLLSQLKENRQLSMVPVIVCSKLINSSVTGQEEKLLVESILGAGTAHPKVPDLPSAEELLRHARQSQE